MHTQLQLRKAFGRRHTIIYNYKLQFIALLHNMYVTKESHCPSQYNGADRNPSTFN